MGIEATMNTPARLFHDLDSYDDPGDGNDPGYDVNLFIRSRAGPVGRSQGQ